MGYYDANDYSIVETGPASWGVQYRNGPFFGGMSSRDQALEYAHSVALASPVNNGGNIATEPRNLQEALFQAEAARDQYRKFLTGLPLADAEDRAPYEAVIVAADSAVTKFSSQQVLVSQTTSATTFEQIDQRAQLLEADAQRTRLMQYAADIRNTDASRNQIAVADAAAFQAEIYYESLVQQQSQLKPAITNGTTQDVLSPQIANTYTNGGSPQVAGAPDPLTTGTIAPTTYPDFSKLNVGQLDTGALQQLNNQITSAGTTLTNINNGTATQDNTFNAGGSSGASGDGDRRVRIAYKKGSYSGILAPLDGTKGLMFPFTPTITYKGSTNYNVLATPHANQDWHIYQNTASVQIGISGMFTAQNPDEAKYMLAALQFLRSVSKMHFGEKDANKGLPPPQCLLSGYGDYMFNRLSVIVNDFSIELPNNVDYVEVKTDEGTSDVPSITTITVSLTVQNTPKKNREFNWDEFASGKQVKDGGWI